MDSEKSAAITEVELTPGSAISVSDLKQDLTNLTPEYKGMLSHIEETLPATNAACDNFYKSHSQMMTVTLDITDLTPVRSIKHTLASIERTKSAIMEAQINMKKNEVKIKKKQREIDNCTDDLDHEEKQIELIELLTNAQSTSKKPEFCVRDAIENNKKSPGTPLFDILKCPLIVLVESSIVARKSVIVEPS